MHERFWQQNNLRIIQSFIQKGKGPNLRNCRLLLGNGQKCESGRLGLLISKCKLASGLPFNVCTKLYDSFVHPAISYSASIWGYNIYSCINAVHNRAMRFFLGVGKYTPVAALEGEMVWEPSINKQWACIGRHFVRTSNTPISRINKRIALWAYSKASRSCRNWFNKIRERLSKLHLNTDHDINIPIGRVLDNLNAGVKLSRS